MDLKADFGRKTLSGYAEHGVKKIMPGGLLDNYGSPPMQVLPLPIPSALPTPTIPPILPGSTIPSLPALPGEEASP